MFLVSTDQAARHACENAHIHQDRWVYVRVVTTATTLVVAQPLYHWYVDTPSAGVTLYVASTARRNSRARWRDESRKSKKTKGLALQVPHLRYLPEAAESCAMAILCRDSL